MSQEDTLRLAAEIVDKFSGPLREMTKSVHSFQDILKGAHTEGSKLAKEQAARQKELNEQFEKSGRALEGLLTPAMGALGLSVAGAGETIGKLIGSLKDAADGFYKLQGATMRTGMGVPELEAYARTLSKITGAPIDASNEQLARLGDTAAKLSRNFSPEFQRLESTFSGLETLNKKMAGEGGAEAARDFWKFYTETSATPDQRRKLLEAYGIDPNTANATSKQFLETLEEQKKRIAEHPLIDMEDLEDLNASFDALKETIEDIGNDFVTAFGGRAAELLDKFGEHLHQEVKDVEAIATAFSKVYDWINKIGPDGDVLGKLSTGILHPGQTLSDMMKSPPSSKAPWTAKGLPPLAPGFQRESFTTGGDESTASRVIHVGTLSALQEWYSGLQAGNKAGGGGSGIINASLGGSGGGAGGAGGGTGGLHSGGGYSVMKGDTGGNLPGGGPQPAPGGSDNTAGGGGAGTGIDRDKWFSQLNANPAMKEELFRRSLGENDNPLANQAVMEEAANRADIRGNKSFGDHSNLSYFQGYHSGPISDRQRKMLESNYDKVFRQGSDISKGAIDNSSQGLAYVHEHGGQSGQYGRPGLQPGRFRTTANFGGDGITGHRGVESFEVPGWGESGRGERDRWAGFRANQLAGAEQRNLLANAGGVGGAQKVEGDASLRVAFENAPAGAKAYMKYGGMFKSGTVDWGHAMPASSPGGGP